MTEINLYSFLAVFFCQVIGALAHWWKLKRTKRTRGNYFSYLFAEAPGKSTITIFLLLGSAWFACSTGSGDLLNPELLWTMLGKGILHAPSINAVLAAMTAGYAFDSIADKGSK